MKKNILQKIKNHETKSRIAYYKNAGKFEWMYSKTMTNLRRTWVALCEDAVSQNLMKKTGDDEFNEYNFGDVCA